MSDLTLTGYWWRLRRISVRLLHAWSLQLRRSWSLDGAVTVAIGGGTSCSIDVVVALGLSTRLVLLDAMSLEKTLIALCTGAFG